jgi:cephalosporin hydroxylase
MSIKAEFNRLKNLIYRRIYMSKMSMNEISNRFHILFYDSFMFDKTWGESRWLGTHVKKCPFDLWVYQEILYHLKPDLIIECGTYKGGSAYFLASICDLIGNGNIVTIDIVDLPDKPQHPRIKYMTGSTLSLEVLDFVAKEVAMAKTVLVLLDDDHTKDHVLCEMRLYCKFVTTGSYLIVEDSNVNGHPVYPNFGPGPYEAVLEFLNENNSFKIDNTMEKFYITFNPNGFLLKV